MVLVLVVVRRAVAFLLASLPHFYHYLAPIGYKAGRCTSYTACSKLPMSNGFYPREVS